MKHIFIFSLIICYANSLEAQHLADAVEKLLIDTSTFGKWPLVQGGSISNNGKYAAYNIYNRPVHSQTIVIQSVDGRWKREFPGITAISFSDDSRKALFMQGEDSLCLLSLGSDHIQYIYPVNTFQLFKQGKEEWLAYMLHTEEKQLVLRSMRKNEEQGYTDVIDYKLSDEGNVLVLKTASGKRERNLQGLKWVDLSGKGTAIPEIVWQGEGIADFILDASGTQVAFVIESIQDGRKGKSIWYYRAGAEKAIQLAGNHSPGIARNLEIGGVSNFSIDGRRIFCTLNRKDYSKYQMSSKGVKVDVWSFTDTILQSQQLVQDVSGHSAFSSESYTAVVDIENHEIIRLQMEHEDIRMISNGKNDNWALLLNRRGNKWEEKWNKSSRPLYYLVSVRTGKRKAVPLPFTGLSPGGKYLLGDDGIGNFFTYELATGTVRNITAGIPIPEGEAGYDQPYRSQHRGMGSCGKWLANNDALLMHDKYDIWQVDPGGAKPPINLTNGYGRKNNITFIFIDNHIICNLNDTVTLGAFDNNNKNSGFYRLVLGKEMDPEILVMAPYIFRVITRFYADGANPIKARDEESYMVWRSSTSEAGNYFWTTDFKKFTPISHVYTEQEYNWLRSELVEFITLDGRKEEGILYKPENFDPEKKYPLIVHYYERKSEQLNRYFIPWFSGAEINIPYFVSQGYLVFTPDIHYAMGEIGQSAYNSIVAAGEHLAKLPYVDGKRMGIFGHSFGGFETNYVIAHSNLFAAACSDAGVVNFINQYGSYELGSGISLQNINENEQNRMGANLWESPDLYIKNSPIFQANKVTTPVLIVNNKLDGIVQFTQGVQFFTALQCMGKRAWLLQYDDESHSLLQRKNQMDLTIRIKQFFDHYLKGVPAPEWMFKGISAKLKGIDSGLKCSEVE